MAKDVFWHLTSRTCRSRHTSWNLLIMLENKQRSVKPEYRDGVGNMQGGKHCTSTFANFDDGFSQSQGNDRLNYRWKASLIWKKFRLQKPIRSSDRCNDQGLYFFDLDNPSSLPNLSRPVLGLTHTSISHLMMKKLGRYTQLNNISLPGSRSHLKRSHPDMKAFFFPYIQTHSYLPEASILWWW